MVSIVVAGEALVDLIVAPDGRLAAIPGGGPYNTARTIARLGGDVAFLGRLSDDRFGRTLRAALESDGVALHHVAQTSDPTTLAVAELDELGVASYQFYLDGTSAPGLTVADAAPVPGPDLVALHVGTLGLVMEPIGATIEWLVDAVAASTLVMLDPNSRPSATPDASAFRARIGRLALRADVIKVSDDDLAFLSPGDGADAAIEQLLATGDPVVLRTDGGRAVEIRTRGQRSVIPVPSVDVVDTVGAGDAFGGGFLQSWIAAGRGRTELADLEALVDSVTFAVRVASLTCTRPGADPPTRAELQGTVR
ncbi:MAG: PfkB family carbohydrate kinase [Candidatus Limnocylindrales bacterium]